MKVEYAICRPQGDHQNPWYLHNGNTVDDVTVMRIEYAMHENRVCDLPPTGGPPEPLVPAPRQHTYDESRRENGRQKDSMIGSVVVLSRV